MKDVFRSFIAMALIQLSNFASGIMLARILLPDGRGELAAAMLWPSVIAGIGILGIHEAVTFHASRRSFDKAVIFKSSLMLGFVLSLVFVLIGWFVIGAVFERYRPEVQEAARLYLAFIPLNFLGLFIIGLFQGGLHFSAWNILRTLVHVVYTVLIPTLYLMGYSSISAFAGASLLANGSIIIVGLIMARRDGWLPALNTGPARYDVGRALATYGAKTHIGALSQMFSERLDQLLISVLLAASDLGLYVVATTVGRLVAMPAQTLGPLVFPKISQVSSPEDRLEIFGRYFRLTFYSAIILVIGIIYFSDVLLDFFFGDAFTKAALMAKIIALAACVMAIKIIFASALKGMGEPMLVSRGELVGLVISGISLAILLPNFGIMGAAMAAVIAQTVTMLILAYGACRKFNTGPLSLLTPGARDFEILFSAFHMDRKR